MSFSFTVQSGDGSNGDLTERVRVDCDKPTRDALGEYLDRSGWAWSWGPSSSFEVRRDALLAITPLLETLTTAGPLDPVVGLDRCSQLGLYKDAPPNVGAKEWPNTAVGDLVNRAKYRADKAATTELALRMAEFACFHTRYREVGQVVWAHSTSPVARALGTAVASALGVAGRQAQVETTRQLRKAKELGVKEDNDRVRPDEIQLGAIAVAPKVLLVDDVWTTGKTLGAIGQACKEQWGTAEVYAIIAARTARGSRTKWVPAIKP